MTTKITIIFDNQQDPMPDEIAHVRFRDDTTHHRAIVFHSQAIKPGFDVKARVREIRILEIARIGRSFHLLTCRPCESSR